MRMEEGSDNQLDEPQEFTAIKKKFLGLGRDGIVVVINYVGSSTNQELQAYCEHLRIVEWNEWTNTNCEGDPN